MSVHVRSCVFVLLTVARHLGTALVNFGGAFVYVFVYGHLIRDRDRDMHLVRARTCITVRPPVPLISHVSEQIIEKTMWVSKSALNFLQI